MDQVTKTRAENTTCKLLLFFQVVLSHCTARNWRAPMEESALVKASEASDPLGSVSGKKVVLN